MSTRSVIDTAWHPLATGCLPEWASLNYLGFRCARVGA
jgi:hypothetical protein